jgi:uncharacterized protein with HEPN domain
MRDSVYIRHILAAVDRIQQYTQAISETDFLNNFMVQDAVIRNLEIVGEASKKVSVAVKEKHPEIPWRQMAGLRDKLIHDYFGIDLPAVWNVVESNLPILKTQLTQINLDNLA